MIILVQTQLASWALMTSRFWRTYALREDLPPMLAAPFLACITPFACRRSKVVGGYAVNTKLPETFQHMYELVL